AITANTTSYDGTNSGLQVGQNLGHITAHFLQSEASLNQACLRDLRTTDPHHDKDRIQKTNGGLLKDSYHWILDNEAYKQWQDSPSSRLLWIRGDPRKGKTMLLCGIIDELTRSIANTANVSFFFCQASDARINTATAVLRGLIYSLVKKQPCLLSYYDHAGKSLFEDINAWNALSRIFTDILNDTTLQTTYLIIDALDEYTSGLPFLLDFISSLLFFYSQVKWIVSSRNWPDIEDTAPISLELNEASVSEAVRRFIQHKVCQLVRVKKYNDETRDTICRHLSSNSQGTFLWVALVCQELDRISRRHALHKLEAFPPGLDALYGRMIDEVRKSEDAASYTRILAVMSIVYRPIMLNELPSVVELPDDLSSDSEALSEIIAICGSFLTVREDTIIFVHQSAKEFLLERRKNRGLPGVEEAEHHRIFSCSLQALCKTLQRDIFQIKFPAYPIEKLHTMRVYIGLTIFIADAMKKKDLDVDQRRCVGDFLRRKCLHWLEALSILGSLSKGIAAMIKLEGLLQGRGEPVALLNRVQDASRFIRYHRLAIESSPLQVYSSPLVFSHMLSLARMCYERERPDWVLNEPLIGVHAFKPSRGLTVRFVRVPGRGVEADSHQRQMIGMLGSGTLPPASVRQPSRGIAAGSTRSPGCKMEADLHQRQMITPSGSGIRPPHARQSTIISSPNFVQFDKVKYNHLHTSIGAFDIGSTALPEQYGYGLNDGHSWITYNGVNLLWLPIKYRPTHSSVFAISATNIAIACSSRRIIFLALTEQSPSLAFDPRSSCFPCAFPGHVLLNNPCLYSQ
ncbi:uncharacterized protein N7477_002001, partial [Penicillium maclennaniae]|uniref:uncharacterized protein n=1 Tax=Penicillium maclennaniae TaxID=1343394 RepID=UPI002540E66C